MRTWDNMGIEEVFRAHKITPEDRAIVRTVYEAAEARRVHLDFDPVYEDEKIALVKEAPKAFATAAKTLGLTQGRIKHRFFRAIDQLLRSGDGWLADVLLNPLGQSEEDTIPVDENGDPGKLPE